MSIGVYLSKNYLLLDDGTVLSLPRSVQQRGGLILKIKGGTLKPAIDGCGYYRVAFKKDESSKFKTFKVHRLVADCFLADKKTEERKEVNHLDGIKTNNSSKNLEWCTRSENVKHSFKKGLLKPMRGEENPRAKFSTSQISLLKVFLKNNQYRGALRKASNRFNISYHVVKDVNRGRTWANVPKNN